MGKANKTMILLLGLLLIVFVYFFNVINTDVLKELDSVVYSKETDIEEQIKIYINASLDKRIFESNVLLGTFRVGDEVYDILMKKEDGFYQGSLYLTEDEQLIEVGKVASSSGLNIYWADIQRIDDKYNADTLVAGPAKTKEEALEIERKIFGK